MIIFPTLYKKGKDAVQQWTIASCGSVITTIHGQVDGKLQTTIDIIREGKNIGRSNETTPEQQADAEASAKHEKQLKKGYVTTLEAALAGDTDAIIEGGIAPMLAHRYDKDGHKMTWPAYASAKLDGLRLIAVVNNGKCTLWTRTRKPVNSLPHIQLAIEKLCNSNNISSCIFDGEAYNHDYRNDFEKITALVRPMAPVEGHEIVQYHIFDLPGTTECFEYRYTTMKKLLKTCPGGPLVLVQNVLVPSEEEMFEQFHTYLNDGYEGLMIRSAESLYENRRSYGLLKVKVMADSEFKIIDVHEGRGKMTGLAIFTCEADNGNPFDVKMKGKLEDLSKYLTDRSTWEGKSLTVQYQNLTGLNGVPRFPVGLRIRND